MPVLDLPTLVAPGRTAIVASEMQKGVIGDEAIFPQLATIAREDGIATAAANLFDAARAVDVTVIHCLATRRTDNKGSNNNGRIFGAAAKSPVRLEPGSRAAEVVDELTPHPDDIVMDRLHGLGPMAGTGLDRVLRNLGAQTVIVVGVSVNVALTNLTMDLVNHGFDVVLVRDAIAGVPRDYANALLDNTLSLLATITTSKEITAAWA
ncbi:MAG: isochorismatase family protein [Nitriliruptorales bacterium]|nr:isochorismatase family protein [Nitriliruptorales bacterium]